MFYKHFPQENYVIDVYFSVLTEVGCLPVGKVTVAKEELLYRYKIGNIHSSVLVGVAHEL